MNRVLFLCHTPSLSLSLSLLFSLDLESPRPSSAPPISGVARAQPLVCPHGEGQRELLAQPVAPPDARVAQQLPRHQRRHQPVGKVYLAGLSGPTRFLLGCLSPQ